MSKSGSTDLKESSHNESVEKSKVAFQKVGTPKLVKQNTATSELTMSALNSANPSAFNSHASIAIDDNASVKSAKSQENKEGEEGPSMGMPGWVPPSANGDIERLTSLLYHYEIMNFNQQGDIDHYKGTYDALAKTIGEQEREKNRLNKKLKTLESTMKYDKIAADGIKRKYNLLELEVKELRYAKDTLTTDLNHYKTENLELVDMLNEDRSNRLKLMHENDKLKKHNNYLINMQKETEEGNIKTNNVLLERLQQLESLVAINKIQSATISGQSEEMLVLTSEVESLKSEALDISSQVIAHTESNDELKNIIRLLQDEVSRLRKELLLNSVNNTSRTISTSYSSRSSRNTNKYTSIVKDIAPGGHERLYEPLDYEIRASTAMASIEGFRGTHPSRRGLRSHNDSKVLSSDDEKHHLTIGESQYSEQTSDHRPLSSTATSGSVHTYYCDNSKTVFDTQKPAHVIDQENYIRAIKIRNSKRSGVVTPLATVKRPPNMDRDSSSTLMEEFSGLSMGGTESLDKTVKSTISNNTEEDIHSQMLEMIQQSGLKKKSRPKTVNHVSNSQEEALTRETMNNMKKCYSMPPKPNKKLKNVTSNVSLLTTSTSEFNPGSTLGSGLPVLPSITGPSVSFSLNNSYNPSAEGSQLDSSESGSVTSKQRKKKVTSAAATAPRTLYISRGLNLKHNEELNNQLNSFGAGSTKDILKKILGDREFI